MYLTNASISALFRRIELFAALSGLFFAHNSLKINCFHHWDGLYVRGFCRVRRPRPTTSSHFDRSRINRGLKLPHTVPFFRHLYWFTNGPKFRMAIEDSDLLRDRFLDIGFSTLQEGVEARNHDES